MLNTRTVSVLIIRKKKSVTRCKGFAKSVTFLYFRNRCVFVSTTFHTALYFQAVMEVTEEGKEADAATATVSDYVSIMKPFDFQINHPFMYIIIDTSNQVVLFMGKYSGQK